jgi:hypothetical protein
MSQMISHLQIQVEAAGNRLDFKGLLQAIWMSLVFALLVFAGTARADVSSDLVCVFQDIEDDEKCPVFTSARAVDIQRLGHGSKGEVETFLVLEHDNAKDSVRSSVSLASRVEKAVGRAEMTEADAESLLRVFAGLAGARYVLPDSKKDLLKQLGFPPDQQVRNDDLAQMLGVHIEMALSISATASEFIIDELGVLADDDSDEGAAANQASRN